MLMKDARLIATDRLYPQNRHSTGSDSKTFPFDVLLLNLNKELGPVQGFSHHTHSVLYLSAKFAKKHHSNKCFTILAH